MTNVDQGRVEMQPGDFCADRRLVTVQQEFQVVSAVTPHIVAYAADNGGRPMVAPTHAIRQACNLLTVCYIISPSINKKAPTQPQNIYGWVGVVYL